MHRPHVLTSLCIFTLVVGTYAYLVLYFPIGYIWATYEDLIGEWTQVWLFVLTFLVSVRLLFLRTRYRVTFALLAACCLYVALEEISWGQRLFGFVPSDFFKQYNLQSELNFHNFVAGPYSTTLKHSIGYGLAVGMVGYGLVYPLLLRRGWRLAVWLDAHGLAAPPTAAAPFFLLAAVLETSPFRFNEAEVAEVLVGFAVAITAIHYAFVIRHDLPPLSSASWSREARSRLAVRLGVTTLLIVSIAANTALALYATPSGRARVERRVEKGVDKFARRYGKFGQWDTAVELLQRLHKREPTNRATMRKLATALRGAGNELAAERYLRRALKVDQKKLEKFPRGASYHRSLVRTYRMLGETVNAEAHLETAIGIGLERVERHPESAKAAYSIGRTYSLMGRYNQELVHLERAHQLRPTYKKYKKAYLNAKHNYDRDGPRLNP